jgi:hypothetical protein
MRKWSAMTFFRRSAIPGWFVLILLVLPAGAQPNLGISRPRFGRSYGISSPEAIQEQEMMQKALTPGFEEDSFTFARLRFDTDTRSRFGRGRLWDDDSPEADLSLTYRVFQVTSLKIHPGLNFVDIMPKDLEKYPFVYVAAAGRMVLSDADVGFLRRYFMNGGFMMADDFWGDAQWEHFREEMKKVFPEREPVELAIDHPIFHSVYQFTKEPQIPSVGTYYAYGTSWEPNWDYYQKSKEPHYYGIFDDKNRMMVLICHNNHFGDGWEHESEDEGYFNTFSEPMGYPMFINILQYTMTH